jgi:hypothetical protein
MSPWEAVEVRFGMNEQEFRETNEEARELLAFWVYGDDCGPHCVYGVETTCAGGTAEVERLNLAFMEAVLKRVAAVDPLPADAGPFEAVRQLILTELDECDAIEQDEGGRLLPTADFTPSAFTEELENVWHVKTLHDLLSWVHTGSQSLTFEEFEQSGGTAGCSSDFVAVFVWAENKQQAMIHLDAQIAEARRVLDCWKKGMSED